MNENEFDLAARAWLDDGPTRISDRALLSALEEIHTTRQRRAVWPAWRATPVSIFARVASAAVLVAVGLLAINVVLRQPDGSSVGGPPTPSATADPTPSPSPSSTPGQALDIPDLTTTFVSPTNGFSMKYFDRGVGTLAPASELWDPASGAPFDDAFDGVETGLGAFFKGGSTEIPEGVSINDWIDDSLASMVSNRSHPCSMPRSPQAEITIDGQPGRFSHVGPDDPRCSGQFVATVIAGGRLYVFILGYTASDASARALFDAFVATVDLTPETAAGA